MRIIRASRSGRFEVVPHHLIRDTRIGYKAKGVLIRLLSNVDGFSMTAQDLADLSPTEGRDSVLSALRELTNSGYALRKKERLSNGQFQTVLYVADTPRFIKHQRNRSSPDEPALTRPEPENPAPVEPYEAPPNSVDPPPRAGEPSEKPVEQPSTTSSLSFPRSLDAEHWQALAREISSLPPDVQQQLLDELEGRLNSYEPLRSPVSFLRAIARKAATGQFIPDAGIPVARQRQLREIRERELMTERLNIEKEKARALDLSKEAQRRSAFEQCQTAVSSILGVTKRKGSVDIN